MATLLQFCTKELAKKGFKKVKKIQYFSSLNSKSNINFNLMKKVLENDIRNIRWDLRINWNSTACDFSFFSKNKYLEESIIYESYLLFFFEFTRILMDGEDVLLTMLILNNITSTYFKSLRIKETFQNTKNISTKSSAQL